MFWTWTPSSHLCRFCQQNSILTKPFSVSRLEAIEWPLRLIFEGWEIFITKNLIEFFFSRITFVVLHLRSCYALIYFARFALHGKMSSEARTAHFSVFFTCLQNESSSIAKNVKNIFIFCLDISKPLLKRRVVFRVAHLPNYL